MNKDEEILKALEGRVLSSIEFVSTYWQLRFDGPQLNVINYPKLKVDDRWIAHDEKEFPYYLINCIDSQVEEVKFENGLLFEIRFRNGILFHVSLQEDNYQFGSAEALLYWQENRLWAAW